MTARQLSLRLAILGALLVAGEAHAAPAVDDTIADFDRATARLARGDHARAAADLVALADRAPDSPRADDALFLAAELHEDELGDPARALALYQRVLSDYPDSRVARAAARRAERIGAVVGPAGQGAGALATFNAIVAAHTERGDEASIADARTLLDAEPTWSGRGRVHHWLGGAHQRLGDFDAAAEHFRAARAVALELGDRNAAFDAGLAAAAAELLRGRDDRAERTLRQLDAAGDPPKLRALEDALARLDRHRSRGRLVLVGYLVIALAVVALLASLRLGAGSTRAALAALRRPPTEVVYMTPLAVLLFGLALTGHRYVAPAVATVCLGALALTYLSGAGLRLTRDRARPIAHATITSAAVLALVYIALERNHLLDIVTATLAVGPHL